MLINLSIKNIAVFEEASIEFSNGFNVITGETGSGKSIIIEALFLLCGFRASKELVRRGKESGYISAAFDITNNEKVLNILKDNGITLEEDDFLIISREILSSGKSINKINGNIVSTNALKDIGQFLLDIYGQFEQQYIYKKENHIDLLDGLVSNEIAPIMNEYVLMYKEYKNTEIEVNEIEAKLINKDQKIEQYEYELEEIDTANLVNGEEEELIKELKKLSNIKEMQSFLYNVESVLLRDDNSAYNLINSGYSSIKKISAYDEYLSKYLEKIEVINEELQTLTFELIDYSENLEYDGERLEEIEKRIALINKLKRKYGFSIEKIFDYRDELLKEYNLLKEADNKLFELKDKLKQQYELLKELASKITTLRKNAASFLEENIVEELNDLNMNNVQFKVNIVDKGQFHPKGVDDVEFLMATNVGDALNSIQKIVSGGEASRIMLALKKLSCDKEFVSTLIFDEIDTGISGKTAQMAGNKMNYISNNCQVICVTHSPQIASISKEHFVIDKYDKNGETFSSVNNVKDEDKVKEIARLLSGLNITKESLDNARDLIRSNK